MFNTSETLQCDKGFEHCPSFASSMQGTWFSTLVFFVPLLLETPAVIPLRQAGGNHIPADAGLGLYPSLSGFLRREQELAGSCGLVVAEHEF